MYACYLCNAAYFKSQEQLEMHLRDSCLRSRGPLVVRKRTPICNTDYTSIKRRRTVTPEPPTLPPDLIHAMSSQATANVSTTPAAQQESSLQENIAAQRQDDRATPESLQLVQSAFRGYAKTYEITCSNQCGIESFLQASIPVIRDTLQDELHTAHGIKFNLWLEADYVSPTGEIPEQPRNFKTPATTIYRTTSVMEITEQLENGMEKLQAEMQEHSGRGSGWTLQAIRGLQLRLSKCSFYRTAPQRYVKLPKSISIKRACVNVKNGDNHCFKHAIISKLYTGNKLEITTEDITIIEHSYNFTNLFFPMPLDGISKFERQNIGTSVNVFLLDQQNKVLPLRIVKEEKEDHFDLLLISSRTDPEDKHYVYIRDFNRLIRQQVTKSKNRITICKRCYTFKRNDRVRGVMTGERWLLEHQEYCNTYKPAEVILPSEEESTMMFRNTSHHYWVPIVIYADLESTLLPISGCDNDPIIQKTRQIQRHEINSFALFVKSDLPKSVLSCWDIPTEVTLCADENPAFKLMTRLKQIAQNVAQLYKQNIPMKELSPREQEEFDSSKKCTFCEKSYDDIGVTKVRDHNHITGEYRSSYCQGCNINLRLPQFVPVVFHNLSGYDSHFLIRVLSLFDNRITVIPSSSEKFISFSVYVDGIELRFLDSYRFTLCSLDSLVRTMLREELLETNRMINDPKKIDLCLRKGVYPYDYIDSVDRFKEEKLPPRELFYNKLTDQHISEEDYVYAQHVWKEFECKTLADYHSLYLQTDVTLLCDVMEAFRNVCYKTYKLDPFHSYTSPGLSWQGMLKKTNVHLQLVTDYDMYLYIESAVRGGLVTCNLRHAVANNSELENPNDYDPSKPTSHIIYLDATNLYGYVMCKYLPTGGFKWVDRPEDIDYRNIPDNSPIGYLLQGDFTYPEELHDLHNDLPLLPKNGIPSNGTTAKLLATLENKTGYVAHHSIFALAEELGMQVTNVRRALQFNQTDWLKSYVEMNTKLRQEATDDFEKSFYKLMNNSIYGKSCENQKNRINVKIVTTEEQFMKETAKVTYMDRTIINDNLVLVHLARRRIKLNRPLYVGQSILDLAKRHMYDFHYNVMLKNFDNIVLIYTDTDSLTYLITTDILHKTMAKLAKHFDFSTYPKEHMLYKSHLPENTKRLGTFKDETSGRQIQEHVGLKAKLYTFRYSSEVQRVGDSVIIKAKGISSSSLKNQFLFDHFKQVLFENKTFYANFNVIRSRNHVVYTEAIKKQALTSHDDKRYIQADGVHTLAYGHYLLRQQHDDR